jgi:hypothetical protein
MDKSLLSISQLKSPNLTSETKIVGYFVASTAPIHVEGDNLPTPKKSSKEALTEKSILQAEQCLNDLADILYEKVTQRSQTSSNSVDLIISIHGFSNALEATIERVNQIYNYINQDNNQLFQERANSLMYVGYRWPSEPLQGGDWGGKIYSAIKTLPLLPLGIFLVGLLAFPFSFLPQFHQFVFDRSFFFIPLGIFLVLMLSFFFIASLVALRLMIYFQDYYRATNFGVPDLVEFIRQLDQTLIGKFKEQYLQNAENQIPGLNEFEKLLSDNLSIKEILDKYNTDSNLTLKTVAKKIFEECCKSNTVDFTKMSDEISNNSSWRKQDIEELVAKAIKIVENKTDCAVNEVIEKTIDFLNKKAKNYWAKEENRINLTFIGHSLGAYVVTSVVRIISDVFDLSSVGTLGSTDKFPTSNIGRVFSLERLVLVSPDIPVTSILSGRANFLRSSLRRFKETYLFSNEGDLALRLASTVANYFSFPASTRESGYRLGNVSIKNKQDYGISYLNTLKEEQHSRLLKSLAINSLTPRSSLADIQKSYQSDEKEDKEQIAKLFTFIDCTDYTEKMPPNSRERRFLSLEKWGWEPLLFYYLRLIIAYTIGKEKIDTHGGYFQGQFSQQLIYRLAFLGFGGFLDSLNQGDRKSALEYLSQKCRQKKIQVILSPERYEVDISGYDRDRVRREMLNS